MKTTIRLLLILLITNGYCQRVKIPKWHSVQESHWQFGLDYMAIDDSGRFISDPLNIQDHWQILPYPSRISVARKTSRNLSFHLLGAYSVYQKGKVVDGQTQLSNNNYWSLEMNTNFHFNNFLGWGRFFDPFLGVGTGFTRASKKSQMTLNTWMGANFWLNDTLAFQMSSMGKFSMALAGNNHLVHSLGLVYRFGIE